MDGSDVRALAENLVDADVTLLAIDPDELRALASAHLAKCEEVEALRRELTLWRSVDSSILGEEAAERIGEAEARATKAEHERDAERAGRERAEGEVERLDRLATYQHEMYLALEDEKHVVETHRDAAIARVREVEGLLQEARRSVEIDGNRYIDDEHWEAKCDLLDRIDAILTPPTSREEDR